MSSIHDANRDEDVNGVIVGGSFFAGSLWYDGRRQYGQHYGYSEEELKDKLNKLHENIKLDMGGAYSIIYPLDSWEMRFYD